MDLNELVKFDWLLQAYFLLMVLDFATGFLKAWKTEGFKSRKLRDGVIRVIGELVAIFFSAILDVTLGLPSFLVRSTKLLFVVKEAVSIVENLGVIGVSMPNVVKDKLYELKEEAEKENTGEETEKEEGKEDIEKEKSE